MRLLSAIFSFLALTFATQQSAAQSAADPYLPFVVIPNADGVIALVGPIDGRTPLAFERVLAENPSVREIVLDSGGGSVLSGLAVASRVHDLGLKTNIPDGSGCYSACSFIFFAGKQRRALGELGVHQIAFPNDNGDLVGGQYAIADILDVLTRFDVHPNIFSVMFRTPPEDMYIFSREENMTYGFLESTPRGTGSDVAAPALILEPVPTTTNKSWFVVAGSYPHARIDEARDREAALRSAGLAVTLIDTNDYSNFANGLFAIVVGPTSKSAAERNLDSIREYIVDAYIKAGVQ